MAEALMRAYTAEISGTSSYIIVNGRKAQVQVATKGAWQIDDVNKYTSATIEHIVLVDLTSGKQDLYVCPGNELRRQVRTRYDKFIADHGGARPRTPDSKHAAISPEQVAVWRDCWTCFD